MGGSKNKYRKVYKGVDYIATKLRKYYPSRYKTKSSSIKRAREINAELVKSGLRGKGTLSNIRGVERGRKAGRKGVPFVSDAMMDQRFYFELQDYPVYMQQSSNEVFFTSKLWSSKIDAVQGGSPVDYSKLFSPYVDYINAMAYKVDPNAKQYEIDWMVMTTKPAWNRAKKRYEAEIISTDGTGKPFDYGFDPDKPSALTSTVIKSGAAQKPTPPTPTPEPKAPQIDPQVAIEKEKTEQAKQANIERAMKLLEKGVITPTQFENIIKSIG